MAGAERGGLEVTLDVFHARARGTPLTTSEVAEELDVSRRSAYDRLDRLADRGDVETKKVGARGRVWWLPAADRGADPAGSDDGSDRDGERARGRMLARLVDDVPGVLYRCRDEDGWPMTFVSEGCEALTGYEAGAVEAGDVRWGEDVVHPADRERLRRDVRSQLEDGDRFTVDYRVRTADGETRWVTERGYRPGGTDGAFLEGVITDVTERRRAEEEFRREHELVERLLETTPVGVAAFDADGDLERANERALEMFGIESDGDAYSVGDVTLRGADGEPLPDEDRPVAEALASTEPVTDREVRADLPDGTTRWVSVNATPITDDAGDVERVVATATDVTTLKEQAERLDRQRAELKRELDEVFDRIDDGFYGLDDEFRFTYVNERAEELLERPEAELLGESIWEVFPETTESPAWDAFHEALETQEPTSYEVYFEPLEFWVEANVYPSETGLSVYFRDVTRRVKRERALEESERRYRTLAENFPNGGVGMFDEDLRYTLVEGTMWDDIEPDAADLQWKTIREALPPDTADDVAPVFRGALEGETGSVVSTLGGRTYRVWATPVRDADGEVTAGQSFALDITERVEREQELERYETIVETVEDGIYALDADGRFTLVNDAFCELVGRGRDELLGRPAETVHPDEELKWKATELAAEVATGDRESGRMETEIEVKDGSHVPVEVALRPLALSDGFGRCGTVRDISERIAREEQRERRARQQEVVADLGQLALETDDLDELFDEAARRVVETLDGEYASVLQRVDEDDDLRLRAGTGWDDLSVGGERLVGESVTQAAYTLASEDPVIVPDMDAESRFEPSDVLVEHGVRSNVSVVVGSAAHPWGVLAVHDTDPREYTENDANFVQSVAHVLATAIDRVEHERRLELQRERLAALNSLNQVVRETTDAVVEQSTREEIERTVCEHLAAADSYRFAWIGDVDTTTQTIQLREEAGVEGYLDGVTVSVDPDDELSGGPAGMAIRTGEVQVVQDITEAESLDPWRDHVEQYGYRSAAAIPVVHGETTYGVLCVYADRPYAFGGEEREVVGQLGELVGHAIAAVERKRALTTDDLVELEFRIPDAFETLDIPVATDERITLDRSVPLGDDEYLLYGTTTGAGVDAVEGIVEAVPHWTDLAVVDDRFGEFTFEVTLSEPPVLSTVASHGGTVQEATFENGHYRMTIHLPGGGDVQRVIERVQDVYPDAEALARRQVSRSSDPSERVEETWLDELTDRQRSALETAYFSGYFEWPRDSSGEEVAERLDISSATLSQHLRNAEAKLLDALFEELHAGG